MICERFKIRTCYRSLYNLHATKERNANSGQDSQKRRTDKTRRVTAIRHTVVDFTLRFLRSSVFIILLSCVSNPAARADRLILCISTIKFGRRCALLDFPANGESFSWASNGETSSIGRSGSICCDKTFAISTPFVAVL